MGISLANFGGALHIKVGTLFGHQVILVTKSKLEIQVWIFGFLMKRRRFQNELVRNFRYEEWNAKLGKTAGIRFEYQGETHTLLKTVEKSETLHTIVRIFSIYRLANSSPIAAGGGTS
jgi:hypothetical protein